jgi:hypothetical protein
VGLSCGYNLHINTRHTCDSRDKEVIYFWIIALQPHAVMREERATPCLVPPWASISESLGVLFKCLFSVGSTRYNVSFLMGAVPKEYRGRKNKNTTQGGSQ